MKSIDASPVMPNLSFSWVRMCDSSALRSSAFDGMHPTLRQTPPQYFCSTAATFLPSWEARRAGSPSLQAYRGRGSSGRLGDPVHRVAGAEVGDARVGQGAQDQHAPVP